MLCPYCKIEYTADQPCFCHPAIEAKPADSEEPRPMVRTTSSEQVAWNSHRGVRLD